MGDKEKNETVGHGPIIRPRELEGPEVGGVIDFPVCPVCGSTEMLVPDSVPPDRVMVYFVNQTPVMNAGFCSGCGIMRVQSFDIARVWRVNRPARAEGENQKG